MKLALAYGFLLAMSLPAQEFRLQQFAIGIPNPTDIQSPGDNTGRVFLVRQDGVIRLVKNGSLSVAPFLSIANKTQANGEQGLLGLAFSPKYAQNGRFYVDYTNLNGNTVISQFKVSSNPDVADPTSETILLTIQQPFVNHNGGQLRFGPDGYLYIGMGDGGSAGDPLHNGQNLGTLLGKLLRIDVESEPGKYHVPPDNPFVNTPGAKPEIWAYGLRNPWRFSFDKATNDLFIADVGQDAYEEVDFQPASSKGGENYGWNTMEGLACYQPSSGCLTKGLTMPVAVYSHSLGCSIAGGFVYRGAAWPGLRGTYLYADYCSGIIWGLTHEGSDWLIRRMINTNGAAFTTFGQDDAGELYVADAGSATIYRVIGAQAPRILNNGVVNAASFAPGISAGSLASVFAAGVLDNPGLVQASQIPLGTSLNGVSVLVNGVAAPVYGLGNANGQEVVNFQVPFSVAGTTSASVVVSRSGQASTAVTAPVKDAQPAIYTSDGTQAIVVHTADNTLVTASRPLQQGEFAYLYASALGPVTNQPATGAAAPGLPLAATTGTVTVLVGGVPSEVQFAGLAPGLVGVYQVNFRTPANAPSGAQSLMVTVGNASSPAASVTVN